MKTVPFIRIASLTLLCTACQADQITVPKEELYTREFIKTFGPTDSSHDWSLAARVTATVDRRAFGNASKIYIYDRMPGSGECQLAACFSPSTESLDFDFAKGNTRAYVQVRDDNDAVIYASYMPIVDSRLVISDGTVSRATPVAAASISLQEISKDDAWGKGVGGFKYKAIKAGENTSCNYPYWNEVKGYETEDWEARNPILDAFPVYGLYTGGSFDDGYLRGTYEDDKDDARPCSDLAAIVGKNGVFHESYVNGSCNLNLYADLLKPEDGVVYKSKGGEITLEYVYGAGINDNTFGYFYYKDGASVQEIMESPKFILMYDASPWNNTKRQTEGDSYENFGHLGGYIDDADGNKILISGDDGGIDNFSGMRPANDMEAYEADKDNATLNIKYKPSFHKLVYYELDEDNRPTGTGSYEFPEGLNIGFFIMCQGHPKLMAKGDEIDNRTNGGKQNVIGEDFRFSIPWMNQLMGSFYERKQDHGMPSFSKKTFEYSPGKTIDNYIPMMSFVTYSWGGEVVMGVEDGEYHESDHDMNDILFFVRGVDNSQTEISQYPKVQSWVVACEDLGGTFDFDFNDVVFGVSHVTTDEDQQEIRVTALAAGGTLPVKLYYNGLPYHNDDIYWNQWFGVNNNSSVINAGRGSLQRTGITVAKKLQPGEVFSMSSAMFRDGHDNPMGGFSLLVEGANGDQPWVKPPTVGDPAPQMILVHPQWTWPLEGTYIWEAYSGNDYYDIPSFSNWCGNHEFYDWAEQASDGSLVFGSRWTPPTANDIKDGK